MEGWARRFVLDTPFCEALSVVTEQLQQQGFEVTGRVDVRDAVRRIPGQDFRQYAIMSFWHPPLGLEALRQDLDIGIELPVTVAVYELADEECVITVGEPLPTLSAERAWHEEWPTLRRIEIDLNERLAHALDGMSRHGKPRPCARV